MYAVVACLDEAAMNRLVKHLNEFLEHQMNNSYIGM